MIRQFAIILSASIGLVAAFSAYGALAAVPSDYGLVEGDLMSATGSSDPDIYIVNDYGYKRLFLNPTIFNFYGHLKWSNVRSISSTTRDAFSTSGLFRNCETNDPKVYAVEITAEDKGMLHWVNISSEQAVAQDPNFFKKVFCINSAEWSWYQKSGVDYTTLSQVPDYSRLTQEQYTVRLIVHYLKNQTHDSNAQPALEDALRDVRDWYFDQLGTTFVVGSTIIHDFSRETWHWTDALREVVDPCQNNVVFVSFNVGEQWQGGTYGADIWGCSFSVPGRVGGYWNAESNPIGLRGWLSHELGHAFGLGHPIPGYCDTVPNVMGGGYTLWPNEGFCPDDVPTLLALPWFSAP